MLSVRIDRISSSESAGNQHERTDGHADGLAARKRDHPLEFGLTQKEGQLFSFLYRSNIVSKDAAMDVLYGDRPNDAPEMKIVDIFICKMRKKVEPFGIKIDTMWGRGYRMPPETKKLVKKYLEPEPEEQE